jgi:hypothetical protein
MTLNLKKGILKQLVLDDLDAKIRKVVKSVNKPGSTSNSTVSSTSGTPSFSINVRGQSPTISLQNQNTSKTPINKPILPVIVNTVKRPGSPARSVSGDSVSVDVEQGIPNMVVK